MDKSSKKNTSVDISPNQPLFAFTPTCTFTKSIYCKSTGVPSG